MGRFIYYTATSINGFIADEDHSLDWLFAVGEEDAGAAELMASVGVQVMGSHTYEWLLAHEDVIEHPEKWQEFFGSMPTLVFTRRDLPIPSGAEIQLVSGQVADHLARVDALADGRDVWVVGGGDLAGQFLDAGRLDRIVLTVAPVFLSGGAPLLPRTVPAERLHLAECRPMGSFARISYDVVR